MGKHYQTNSNKFRNILKINCSKNFKTVKIRKVKDHGGVVPDGKTLKSHNNKIQNMILIFAKKDYYLRLPNFECILWIR